MRVCPYMNVHLHLDLSKSFVGSRRAPLYTVGTVGNMYFKPSNQTARNCIQHIRPRVTMAEFHGSHVGYLTSGVCVQSTQRSLIYSWNCYSFNAPKSNVSYLLPLLGFHTRPDKIEPDLCISTQQRNRCARCTLETG